MLPVQQEVNDVTLFQTPLLLCEDSLPWLKQHKDIVKISVLMWHTITHNTICNNKYCNSVRHTLTQCMGTSKQVCEAVKQHKDTEINLLMCHAISITHIHNTIFNSD